MIETAEVYALIEEYRKKLGLSQAEVSKRAFGQDSSAAIQGLRRGKSPGIERLSAISKVLGLELYFGPPRPTQSQILRKNGPDPFEDFALVERFDVTLSAGPGAAGVNVRELSPVAFRYDWLAAQSLSADQCVVATVGGDSMSPLIRDGDLILLNRQRGDLVSGEVYGFVDVEGDLLVKRLAKIDGGLLLQSENSSYPPETRLGEDANRVRIIGRYAWSGHSHSPMIARRRERSTFTHDWI